MKEYLVEWSIELSAESPEDAARQALEIQRDPDSSATVFYVMEFDGDGEPIRVDLDALDDYDDLVANNVPVEER